MDGVLPHKNVCQASSPEFGFMEVVFSDWLASEFLELGADIESTLVLVVSLFNRRIILFILLQTICYSIELLQSLLLRH